MQVNLSSKYSDSEKSIVNAAVNACFAAKQISAENFLQGNSFFISPDGSDSPNFVFDVNYFQRGDICCPQFVTLHNLAQAIFNEDISPIAIASFYNAPSSSPTPTPEITPEVTPITTPEPTPAS